MVPPPRSDSPHIIRIIDDRANTSHYHCLIANFLNTPTTWQLPNALHTNCALTMLTTPQPCTVMNMIMQAAYPAATYDFPSQACQSLHHHHIRYMCQQICLDRAQLATQPPPAQATCCMHTAHQCCTITTRPSADEVCAVIHYTFLVTNTDGPQACCNRCTCGCGQTTMYISPSPQMQQAPDGQYTLACTVMSPGTE